MIHEKGQERAWDREYAHSTFLTKDNKPQADVVRFVSFLKKQKKIKIHNLNILDLGSGAGRNAFYFAELKNHATGIEISGVAIHIAQKYAHDAKLPITYIKQSIGEKFPLKNEAFDMVLDVTSSNSLTSFERNTYLRETHRVLRPGGHFFLKALCLEGDLNAKFLLKHNPGTESQMYIMPDTGIMERVWTEKDLRDTYEPYFTILHLEKKTSYTRMNDRVYKRNFWIAYMRKGQS